MTYSVIVHFLGEDAVVGEVDQVPDPTHNFILVRNPKTRDGKVVPYIDDRASAVIFPWNRITFVETMGDVPSMAAGVPAGATAAGQPAPGTTIFGFFREDDKNGSGLNR